MPFHKLREDSALYYAMIGFHPRPKHSANIGLSDEIWEVLQLCWNKDAHKRPGVQHVLNIMTDTSPNWTTSFAAFDEDSDSESSSSEESTADKEILV